MPRRTAPLLLTLALLLPFPVNAGDRFELEKGFTLLFNGKDLTGWKEYSGKAKASLDGKTNAYKGRFAVVEGTLVIDPAVKGDLHIETQKEFGKDVHIKFDFEPGPKCNNDLFLRGTKFDIIAGKVAREGAWQTFEIVVTGDKIEHKIDGKTVRTSKAKGGPTPFRIRAEFGAMKIKNIRVKE